MSNTCKCDICGKDMVPAEVHSGDGVEDLCLECYHDVYDMDDEVAKEE